MECTLRGIFQTHFKCVCARASTARVRAPRCILALTLPHRRARWSRAPLSRRSPRARVLQLVPSARLSPVSRSPPSSGWSAERARLVGCAHPHLIFTIPHELNALWCWNRALMANLLFSTVRAVLCELLEDPRYLGAGVHRGAAHLGTLAVAAPAPARARRRWRPAR